MAECNQKETVPLGWEAGMKAPQLRYLPGGFEPRPKIAELERRAAVERATVRETPPEL